jgi:hypothetical protein
MEGDRKREKGKERDIRRGDRRRKEKRELERKGKERSERGMGGER